MMYVIHAFEEKYGGYHGIEDWSIENCNNEEEAVSIARENSLEVINSYSLVYEELEDDIEQLRADIYNEDIAYNIWKIDSDIIKEYDIDILEEWLNNDPEDFIEKYCNDELL